MHVAGIRLPRLSALCVLVLASIYFQSAAAEPASDNGQASQATVAFQLSFQKVADGNVQLVNGVTVDIAKWNTLLIAEIPFVDPITLETKQGSCTATLIGPQTVLLAAHCVDLDDPVKVQGASITMKGKPDIKMDCAIDGDYKSAPYRLGSPRSSADYALCALRSTIPNLPNGYLYESIDEDHPLGSLSPVLMTGYGCTEVAWEAGDLNWTTPAAPILRIGDQKIEIAPTGSGGDANYALLRSALIKTPALCPGDSGGPMFTGVTVATRDDIQNRRIRAVNSSLQAVKPGTTAPADESDTVIDLISRVADLSQPSFRRFLQTWLTTHPAVGVVCGHENTAGRGLCR